MLFMSVIVFMGRSNANISCSGTKHNTERTQISLPLFGGATTF